MTRSILLAGVALLSVSISRSIGCRITLRKFMPPIVHVGHTSTRRV